MSAALSLFLLLTVGHGLCLLPQSPVSPVLETLSLSLPFLLLCSFGQSLCGLLDARSHFKQKSNLPHI